jgi:hypothetical protein
MTSKKVAIVQSNYIPWKGYFDLIGLADEFILYDDVQYTRRDWRNRNMIKSPSGSFWLSIPVEVKGQYFQKIKDTKVSEHGWRDKHWKSICCNYSKTRFFKEYSLLFEELYFGSHETYLSEINYKFITAINKLLGITTKISWSSDYNLVEGKTERLVDLCKQINATVYISGPSAKGYIKEEVFEEDNIQLIWMDYSSYPEYHQLYPPFTHQVSIIDLLFNEGPNAPQFMKSFTNSQEAAL